METKDNDTIKAEVDDPVSHVREVSFGTPVILREILKQFSNRELVKLSLVNKLWNFEARSVLRNRGSLKAKLWLRGLACQDLVAFASDLSQMRVVPFSGISVDLFDRFACAQSSSLLDPSYNVILERLPITKLSVCFAWVEFEHCSAMEFVKKILRDFGGILEILSLDIYCNEMELVLPRILKLFLNSSLPRLKLIKLDAMNTDDNFTQFLKGLVSLAPNLQELSVPRDLNFNENFLQGSSVKLVREFTPLFKRIFDALTPKTTESYRMQTEGFIPISTFLPLSPQEFPITLSTLRSELLFIVPWTPYGIWLKNVRTLEIRPDDGLVEWRRPRLLLLHDRFECTNDSPKLQKFEIENGRPRYFFPAQIKASVWQGNVVFVRTLSYHATNTRQGTVLTSISDSVAAFLAHTPPHVKTLTVSMIRNNTGGIPLVEIQMKC